MAAGPEIEPGTARFGGSPRDGSLLAGPAQPGEPALRWSSRAGSIAEIERELARIWAEPTLTVAAEGGEERRIAARTSVMNLVVIARRPEVGERAAAAIAGLTGRHPSRTLIVSAMDPDGPSWLDARVQAYCMLPRADAPETCAEAISIVAGGESGRRFSAIVAPLLVHDLPVTVWWPGEPPLDSRQAADVLALADRFVVDGSRWAGDGLDRVAQLARIAARGRPTIFDFALVRQARWREAIASLFDHPELLPYLRSIRRVAVTYAAGDLVAARGGELAGTNIVKPVYHVAWLASRLGWSVASPLAAVAGQPRSGSDPGAGLMATLRGGRHDVVASLRPVASSMPPGTTLRVEIVAERRGSELRAEVTAEAALVRARAWRDGDQALDRALQAPRRTEIELLTEAIEMAGADPVTAGAIRAAGALVGQSIAGPPS
jgi:hypothetical protein